MAQSLELYRDIGTPESLNIQPGEQIKLVPSGHIARVIAITQSGELIIYPPVSSAPSVLELDWNPRRGLILGSVRGSYNRQPVEQKIAVTTTVDLGTTEEVKTVQLLPGQYPFCKRALSTLSNLSAPQKFPADRPG